MTHGRSHWASKNELSNVRFNLRWKFNVVYARWDSTQQRWNWCKVMTNHQVVFIPWLFTLLTHSSINDDRTLSLVIQNVNITGDLDSILSRDCFFQNASCKLENVTLCSLLVMQAITRERIVFKNGKNPVLAVSESKANNWDYIPGSNDIFLN